MIGRAACIGLLALVVAVGPVAAASVQVVIKDTNTGFKPAAALANLGDVVQWANDDDISHTSTGNSPLSLWNKALPAGGDASFAFRQSGRFLYHCKIHPSMKGSVRVRMQTNDAFPDPGDTATLRVATDAAPGGFRYRIQRRHPGDPWKTWRTITAETAKWTPKAGAIGAWQFRARTERISNGAASGWSPTLSIEVG